MAKKEEKKPAPQGQEKTKDAEQPKSKISPLLIAVIVLSVLLVIVSGVAAYFIFFAPPPDKQLEEEMAPKKEAKKEEKKKEEKTKKEDEPVNLDLDPFLVNLSEPKAKHFLKVTITLQIKNEATKPEVEKKVANIKNDILLLLSSKTIEDVITVEGKIRLKEEIMVRVNKIVGEGKVTDIFFSQFVVQ